MNYRNIVVILEEHELLFPDVQWLNIWLEWPVYIWWLLLTPQNSNLCCWHSRLSGKATSSHFTFGLEMITGLRGWNNNWNNWHRVSSSSSQTFLEHHPICCAETENKRWFIFCWNEIKLLHCDCCSLNMLITENSHGHGNNGNGTNDHPNEIKQCFVFMCTHACWHKILCA